MIAKSYWVYCDGSPASLGPYHAPDCVERGPIESTSQKARLVAKRQGWKRFVGKGRWDSRDLSPQCAAPPESDDV